MIFMGCANSSGGGSSGNGTEEDSGTEAGTETGTETVTPPKTISSVIGADGGEVGDDNAMISIPAGALKEDTEISIKYLNDAKDVSDTILTGFVGAVEFGPSGTKFEKPADVVVKLSKAPKNETLSIFCYDEENKRWNYETTAEIDKDYAKFEVNHFSRYRIVDITDGMLQKYINIIKYNFDNNIPDTVSREQYEDYLNNTVKVLDSYEEWGGKLYKACGYLISVNYYINGVEEDPNDLIDLVGEDSDRVKPGDLLCDSYSSHVINGEEIESETIIIYAFLAINYKPVETYEFSGHIKEEKEFDYEFYDYGYTHALTVTPGKTKLIFDYDYTGFFFVEDGNLNGTIEFKNVKASAQTKSAYAHYQSGDSHNVTLLANAKFDCSDYSSNITGICDDLNRCEIYYDGYYKNLVNFEGSTDVTGAGPVLGGEHWTFTGDSVGYLTVGGKDNKALLSFYLLADETQENSLEDFKDSFFLSIEEEIVVQDSNYTPSEMKLVSHKETTSQTITLKAVTEDD
jgi:hypothetical protein